MLNELVIANFWKKVDIKDDNSCWNWYRKTRDRDNTIRDLRQEAIKWIKEVERLRVSEKKLKTIWRTTTNC